MQETEELVAEWRQLVEAAVEVASDHPEEIRTSIIQGLLSGAVSPDVAARSSVRGEGTATDDESADEPESTQGSERDEEDIASTGLAAVSKDTDIPLKDLERHIEVGDDGKIRIYGDVGGSNMKETSQRLTALYCYLRQRLFGERTTEADELRDLCRRHDCYSSGNFARYLDAGDYLMEEGVPGSSAKNYRLSRQGESAAKDILDNLAG